MARGVHCSRVVWHQRLSALLFVGSLLWFRRHCRRSVSVSPSLSPCRLCSSAYVQQLGDLLDEKVETLVRFRERLAVYRSQLAEEELISRNIKPAQRR